MNDTKKLTLFKLLVFIALPLFIVPGMLCFLCGWYQFYRIARKPQLGAIPGRNYRDVCICLGSTLVREERHAGLVCSAQASCQLVHRLICYVLWSVSTA